MNEIECITDQLLGFTEEVETVVSTFIRKGYTKDQAIRIVELGIEDIKAEVEYQRNKRIDKLIEAYDRRTYTIEEREDI
ncbi:MULTISPECIES: hypothetical protein [unclassified Clostridium]|uniref:hypothetical protein n=1 Tax=unclassified Clostridium TaxID=2614128 RepID=UPI002A801ECC|nr:hypothetical protein [Clostridium sp.]MDY4252993.1 hypothetical protein [Clostridium sp.]